MSKYEAVSCEIDERQAEERERFNALLGAGERHISRNRYAAAFVLTGSFCSIAPVLEQMKKLAEIGVKITPVMSEAAAATDTRFFKAADLKAKVAEIAQNDVITSFAEAERLGPAKMADILMIAPCTSNTLAKIARGINDTAATMAAKSVLRNEKPVVVAVSTNDGLGASCVNIGTLLNRKGFYFVPFAQDDPLNKPRSLVARFELIIPTIEAALDGRQIQPIIRC